MIEVMKIVNTHGVKGDLKAIYYADSPEFFEKVPVLYDEKGEKYTVLNAREYKGAILLNIEGVTDMTEAEKLKGKVLFARREDFPPLGEGEYYLTDLIGMTAVTSAGEKIGVLDEVLEKPAQNLLRITSDEGREILIPNCKPFVKNVDLAEKKIVIEPIEGLI